MQGNSFGGTARDVPSSIVERPVKLMVHDPPLQPTRYAAALGGRRYEMLRLDRLGFGLLGVSGILGGWTLRTSRSCGQRENPLRRTPPVRIQRLDPIAFDFDSNGPLEKTYGDHNPALLAQFDQNAFDARQRAKFDANALAHVQERPRLDIEPGSHSFFNGRNLGLVDGDWTRPSPTKCRTPGMVKIGSRRSAFRRQNR